MINCRKIWDKSRENGQEKRREKGGVSGKEAHKKEEWKEVPVGC